MKTVIHNWTTVNSQRLCATSLAMVVAALALPACGARARDRVEGETHWLSACSESSACDDGQSCICGVCTVACEADDACRDFPSAACSASGLTPYEDNCGALNSSASICVRESDVRPSDVDSGEPSTGPQVTSESSSSQPALTQPGATSREVPHLTSDEVSSADQDASAALPCKDAGVAAELAATPREDQLGEVLAILASDQLVATDEDYARAVRDHAALVAIEPRVAAFGASGASPAVGNQVILQFVSADRDFAMAAQCVNDAYGATIADEVPVDGTRLVFLHFDGVFNLDLLSQVYSGVPGVTQAYPDVPTPPPVIVDNQAFVRSVTRAGDTWAYAFNITRSECNIALTITTDVDGDAQIAEWQAEPDVPACQRGDAGM